MALTIKDAHQIMNLLVKEISGQNSTIQNVDSSNFVDAGAFVLAAGTENVYNALSKILGRTFVAARPYNAKLDQINSLNSGLFSHRLRKISFYSQNALPSGAFNTNLFTNLKDGFTAGENKDSNGVAQSTKSQFEQVQAMPLEMNFYSSSTWQDGLTRYDWQIQEAFRSESSFISFIEGAMIEKLNDIEQQKEAYNRMVLLNRIGETIDMASLIPGGAVNLTAEFNTEYGTSYSTSDLLTTYRKELLAFFVTRFKLDSDRLTYRTNKYHWDAAKTVDGVSYSVLRHTPKDKQRTILYNPFFVEAEATVLPEIFNDQYLKVENGERVDWWQNFNDPAAIDVTPGIFDSSAGTVQGARVQVPYVLGCLYDVDALMTDFQLEASRVSPIEARKGYMTTWWTFLRGALNDVTENFIVYYLADPS